MKCQMYWRSKTGPSDVWICDSFIAASDIADGVLAEGSPQTNLIRARSLRRTPAIRAPLPIIRVHAGVSPRVNRSARFTRRSLAPLMASPDEGLASDDTRSE